MDSFQSNCSCWPGAVSNLGWGSGPAAGPTVMPCVRMNCVKAPYLGSPSSGWRCSRYSYMPRFVTPGRAAFCTISSLCASKALRLSARPSCGRHPSELQ